METRTKDPNAVLDYQVDWSDWLGSSDSISSSVWDVPDGITKDSDSKGTDSATIWLSGGTVGQRYIIVNRVTTTPGARTEEYAFEILVLDSKQDPVLYSIDPLAVGIENCYATVDELRRRAPARATDETALLLDALAEASRHVDAVCGRPFHPRSAVRYLDVARSGLEQLILPGDLLSVTEVATDPDTVGTFDTAWVDGTDYYLEPSGFLPYRWIRRRSDSQYVWPAGQRRVRMTGVWGYGDGRNADPWSASAVTCTVADASTTVVTLGGANPTVVQAGMTIRVGSEQLFVTLVSDASASVVRGVNGTTAAAHSGATVELPLYPLAVRRATLVVAVEILNLAALHGFSNERAGDWSYSVDSEKARRRDRRILMRLIRRNG